MKNFMKTLFHYINIIGIIFYLASCSSRSQEWEKLQDVEIYIHTHADSALVVLQNIQQSSLSNKEEKAKHALLLSMALDKNVIDRTDFEVLQPAIDYYRNHGTATDKLRTLYYEGRIYQNAGQGDLAMKSFIKAREVEGPITDTLTLGNLLVAQATYYYSTYKVKEFIANNQQAARLYEAIGHSYYQFRSLLNTLDGSILNNDKPLADSILTCCRSEIEKHPDYEASLLSYILSYTITFGSDEEIRTAIESCLDKKHLSRNAKLKMALGYSKIGEAEKALQIFTEASPSNSLSYLAIQMQVLKSNGKYKDALDAYQSYSNTLEKKHQEIFSQDLLFAQEKHDLEVASLLEIQKRNKLVWYSICCVLALLSISGFIYYHYRIGRSKRIIAEQENTRLRLEQENLGMRISQLESESEHLKNLLSSQEELAGPIAEAVRIRIEMLNGLLASQIAKNEAYTQPYSSWVEEILKDRDAFMDSTRLAFKVSHPQFIQHLESHGLTEWEINYCCLYALGLKGKEVGTYIKMRSHYNVSSDIREKLGICEHDTNLGIYLRKLLANS